MILMLKEIHEIHNRKANIDEIDLNIIDKINSLKSKDDVITTYQIAKQLFQCDSAYELKRKDNFIRERLKKLKDYGLIEIIKNGRNNFFLLCKNVERKKKWSVFGKKQDSYFLRIYNKWYVFPFKRLSSN